MNDSDTSLLVTGYVGFFFRVWIIGTSILSTVRNY